MTPKLPLPRPPGPQLPPAAPPRQGVTLSRGAKEEAGEAPPRASPGRWQDGSCGRGDAPAPLSARGQHRREVSKLAPAERRRMASISVFTRGKSGQRSYLAGTKWQMEPVSPAARVQQAGFHQY